MSADKLLSTKSDDKRELPQRWPLLCRWFTRYARRYVAKHFHAVRVLNAPPTDRLDNPLVLYLNHPGWWDPLIGMVLSDHFYLKRTHFAPMDAQMLKRYRIFNKLGFFPVDPASPHRGGQFLAVSRQLLGQSRHAMWMTAQGAFCDPRVRPVRLMPGIAHLAARHRHLRLQPVAVEYPFWSERLPEALINFGPPVSASDLPDKVESIQRALEGRLTETLDDLAAAATHRDRSDFQTILSGSAGTGGIYQLIERWRAWRHHERYDPAHQPAKDEA